MMSATMCRWSPERGREEEGSRIGLTTVDQIWDNGLGGVASSGGSGVFGVSGRFQQFSCSGVCLMIFEKSLESMTLLLALCYF